MRHFKLKHKKRLSLWAAPCAVVLLAVMAVWQFQPSSVNEFMETTSDEIANPFAKALKNPSPELAELKRLVYPYSVVAGGVHQRDELHRAVAQDRVVAEHYADFDVS